MSKPKVIRIPAGETKELFYGVNVTGRVYFKIRTSDGTNTVRMWWTRVGPLFQNKHLGTKKDSGYVKIPGFSINPRLKARATSDTAVAISYDDPQALISFTFTF